MADFGSLARPYSKGVFQAAEASNTFGEWSAMLQNWSQMASHEKVRPLFNDPKVKPAQLQKLFEVDGVTDHGKRFINMLISANRLEILPDIARIYEALCADREGTVKAQVFTTKPLSEDQNGKIREALSKRFNRTVTLEENIDTSLIAGVKIRVNDMVWDSTIRGRLTRLAENLIG